MEWILSPKLALQINADVGQIQSVQCFTFYLRKHWNLMLKFAPLWCCKNFDEIEQIATQFSLNLCHSNLITPTFQEKEFIGSLGWVSSFAQKTFWFNRSKLPCFFVAEKAQFYSHKFKSKRGTNLISGRKLWDKTCKFCTFCEIHFFSN